MTTPAPYFTYIKENAHSNMSANESLAAEEDPLKELYHLIRIPMTLLWLSILLVGLLGNVAFMYVAIRVRWMRTVTNYYLMNLCLADITFLVGNVPIEVAGLYGAKLCPIANCFLTTLLLYLCQYVGMFSITILSIERYYAICCPLTSKKLSSKSRSRKLLIVAWVAATLLSVLFCVTCVFKDRMDRPYRILSMVVQTLPLVASMIIVLFLYLFIGRQVANSTQAEAVPCRGTRQRKERKQVVNLLIITAVIFFLSFGPYQGFLMYFNLIDMGLVPISGNTDFKKYVQTFYMTNAFFITLLYVNSAINPIIYNVTSSKYRQAFKEAFPWLCWKSKPILHHERMFSDRYSDGNGTQTYSLRHSTSPMYKHYPVSTLTIPTTV
ncbi:neuromedin-U receptor 2-like [Glandiceps talaboti]